MTRAVCFHLFERLGLARIGRLVGPGFRPYPCQDRLTVNRSNPQRATWPTPSAVARSVESKRTLRRPVAEFWSTDFGMVTGAGESLQKNALGFLVLWRQ